MLLSAPMNEQEDILAKRLGKTVHASPLRFKLLHLRKRYPSATTECIEDWLVDVANARGARIVQRPIAPDRDFAPPPPDVLSNEELVVAICQFQCLDRPQMLRLAAQLISRNAAQPSILRLVSERERVEPVLAELARLALRIDPQHVTWRQVMDNCASEPPLREPLLHWTRLAQPVMKDGKCNAERWELVA